MSAWTPDELARIGHADELEIASRRQDGSFRPHVTIWTVRAGDQIFVRSAYGYDNGYGARIAVHPNDGRSSEVPGLSGRDLSPRPFPHAAEHLGGGRSECNEVP